MGAQQSAGDFYALKIRLETVAPLSDPTSVAEPGTTLYITVLVNGQARHQLEYVMGGRGAVKRLDFGTIDADGDGLPDGWEQAYMITTGYGPDDDPDNDSLNNRDEYRLGTHPMKADAPHPADISPRDSRITIAELSAYYSAWKAGRPWTVAPTNIPIEYVTRASWLWEAGEYYKLDLTLTNPPIWWVSVPAPTNTGSGLAMLPEANSQRSGVSLQDSINVPPLIVDAVISGQFQANTPAVIIYKVSVKPGLRIYALEDHPPEGWVVSGISPGGSYDPQNQKVKWGPFFDRQPRELVYTVAPVQVSADQLFLRVGSYDGWLVAIDGRRTVESGSALAELVRLHYANNLHEWSLVGKPGVAYLIEYSADFAEWKPLSYGTADALGRLGFTPVVEGLPRCFFRAVAVPVSEPERK
jgi:hypothetical protein